MSICGSTGATCSAYDSPVDMAIYGNNVTNDRHVTIDNDLTAVVGVDSETIRRTHHLRHRTALPFRRALSV